MIWRNGFSDTSFCLWFWFRSFSFDESFANWTNWAQRNFFIKWKAFFILTGPFWKLFFWEYLRNWKSTTGYLLWILKAVSKALSILLFSTTCGGGQRSSFSETSKKSPGLPFSREIGFWITMQILIFFFWRSYRQIRKIIGRNKKKLFWQSLEKGFYWVMVNFPSVFIQMDFNSKMWNLGDLWNKQRHLMVVWKKT